MIETEKKDMFLGRTTELSELNKLYDMEGFKFIVIYGRRRVGKTALMAEFTKDKDSIFYISIEQNDKAALETFSVKVLERFSAGASIIDSFPSWDKAFSYITEQAGSTRLVLAIDEYPYLASGCPSISSILQKHIDTGFGASNLFLILCGSSMSFMENQVLGYNSPLYGRRTAQFKLEPLNYLQTAEACPNLSTVSNALIYGIAGGIPHYINKLAIKKDNGIDKAITENLLEKTSYLFEEPANLLKQELREPATYNAIIAAMASGAARLNDISTKTSLDYSLCSKYLSVLISLDIVGKKSPIFDKTKNKTLYFIKDNLFSFWYRFVPDNISQIMADKSSLVFKNEVKPQLNHYMGKIFEEICCQYLIYGADNLPFIIKEIGSWWGGNPKTKTQEEIDILATNGKSAIFGECKWQTDLIDLAVLKNLKRKAELFDKFENKYYYLFSKSGFTMGVSDVAQKDNSIRLITLADMYLVSGA